MGRILSSLVSALFLILGITQSVLFFTIIPANADQASVRRIDISDGLSHFNVRDAVEDELGRIWFATANGINIYDGYEFQVFRHQPDNANSISSSDIKTLFKDSQNRIWIGTLGGGINLFIPETQSFKHYEVRGDFGQGSHDVFAFFEDVDGNIWAGTHDGLVKFNSKNDEFISAFDGANNARIIPDDSIRAIAQTESGKLWLGFSRNGLCKYTIKTQSCEMFLRFVAVKGTLTSNHITALHVDKDKTLWIGTSDNGINLLKYGEDEFANFNLDYLPDGTDLANNRQTPNDKEISSFAQDADGNIWVGTENNGLNRYDSVLKEFSYYQSSPADNHTISSNTVSFVYIDSNNRAWVGSPDAGISTFAAGGSEFAHFRHDPLMKLGPQGNTIWSFANSIDGTAWVGSRQGLDRFVPWTEEFIPYLNKSNLIDGAQISHVYSLFSDDMYIWIGTKSQGLFRFNVTNEKLDNWNSVFYDGTLMELRGIRHLLKDKTGRLWIGDEDGLYWLDTKNGILEPAKLKPQNLFSDMAKISVNSMYEDQSGYLWIGTSQELMRYNMKTKLFEKVRLDGRSFSNVNAIYQQEDNIFWLATNTGLYKLDFKENEITHFDERNDFPSPLLYSLIPDQLGNLWITISNGLVRFNMRSQIVDVFTFHDGLQNKGFNKGAYMQTESGTIYVGGVNGFNIFDPMKVQDLSTAKTLLSAEVISKDGSVLFLTPEDDGVELPYREDRIEFKFSPIHFKNPAGNRFEYRLFNYDTGWQKGVARDDNRKVSYEDLPPGDYRFVLRTSGNIGVWSTPVGIEFSISQPLWTRWWAYLLYFALGVLAIAAVVRWRSLRLSRQATTLKKQVESQTNEIIKKNEELEQLLDFRSRFYRRAAHELRTPLTLVQLPLQEYVADKVNVDSGEYEPQKNGALVMVLRNIQRLKRITDQMLQYSKTPFELKGDLQIIDLRSTLMPLLDMSEKNAIEKGIRFYHDEIPKAAVTLDRDALEDIVVNLLSNAIKYTEPGGMVSFNLTLSKATLVIEIQDTGIGISKEEMETVFKPFFRGEEVESDGNGFGVGLSVVKDRIESSKSQINFHSVKNSSTEFTVTMPVLMPSVDELTELPENLNAIEYWPIENSKTQRSNLLVIEDDPDMCLLLRSILSLEFNVDVVSNCKDAKERILEMPYDAIITDALLPDGSGFDLLLYFKAQPEVAHLPIILLTALAESEHMERALELGADDYVVKPFSSSELLLRIKSHISNRGRVGLWWNKQLSSDFANLEDTTEKLTKQRVLSPKDSTFLDVLRNFVEEEMGKSELTLPIAAKGVAVSERQIQRKLKALLDSTFTEYVTELRMRKAAILLETGRSVKEVSGMVGYNDASHFASLFKERFGVTPSKFNRGDLVTFDDEMAD